MMTCEERYVMMTCEERYVIETCGYDDLQKRHDDTLNT